jgi:putative flippase GtrA
MQIASKIRSAIDFFYIKPFSQLLSRQIFRYAVCGGVNMVLDLVWYFLIYHFLVAKQFVHIFDFVISPHVAALLIVFPITFLTGFWLNRYVVFQVWQYNGLKQVFKYALTVVGSLILNYVCIKFFVEVCAIWPTPAKALTTLVCVSYSYLLGRYFTFVAR